MHSGEGETRELAVADLERAVAHLQLQRIEKGGARWERNSSLHRTLINLALSFRFCCLTCGTRFKREELFQLHQDSAVCQQWFETQSLGPQEQIKGVDFCVIDGNLRPILLRTVRENRTVYISWKGVPPTPFCGSQYQYHILVERNSLKYLSDMICVFFRTHLYWLLLSSWRYRWHSQDERLSAKLAVKYSPSSQSPESSPTTS